MPNNKFYTCYWFSTPYFISTPLYIHSPKLTNIFSQYCFRFQYKQKHAILVETSLLKEMPDALSSPFPELFYIQAKLANIKVSKCVLFRPHSHTPAFVLAGLCIRRRLRCGILSIQLPHREVETVVDYHPVALTHTFENGLSMEQHSKRNTLASSVQHLSSSRKLQSGANCLLVGILLF